MADDILQFVDSIAAAPTVRLDMNDAASWGTRLDTFDFSHPPLRQARAGTLLTDGEVIPSSSYGNRILRGTFEVLKTTIDLDATQIQLLNRELDRDCNYLKWQPNGATSPVFFRTFRSPIKRVNELPGSGTYKTFEFEIEAEPFALGLREDIVVGTVNNDPAAGANGQFFDVTNVKGDIAAPIFVTATAGSAEAFGLIAARQHGTPSDLLHFVQCESMTPGPNTANPGGGPDAAMSGTGTNNFLRITFSGGGAVEGSASWAPTLTDAQRKALHGRYRAFVVVRRGDASTTMTLTIKSGTVNGTAVTIPKSIARQIVDVGLISINAGLPTVPGRYSVEAPVGDPSISIFGDVPAPAAATLDLDYLLLAPADESFLLWGGLTPPWGIDGQNESAYLLGAGALPFSGNVRLLDNTTLALAGGFPVVTPGQTSRFIFAVWTAAGITKGDTTTLTVSYWPRYLYIRPAAT